MSLSSCARKALREAVFAVIARSNCSLHHWRTPHIPQEFAHVLWYSPCVVRCDSANFILIPHLVLRLIGAKFVVATLASPRVEGYSHHGVSLNSHLRPWQSSSVHIFRNIPVFPVTREQPRAWRLVLVNGGLEPPDSGDWARY